MPPSSPEGLKAWARMLRARTNYRLKPIMIRPLELYLNRHRPFPGQGPLRPAIMIDFRIWSGGGAGDAFEGFAGGSVLV